MHLVQAAGVAFTVRDPPPPETKREWGTRIRMTDEIIERVTARWPELGLPGSGRPIWK